MKGPRLSFILISLLFLFIVSMHVHLVRGKEEKDKNYALHEFRSFSKDGLREKVSCQKEEPPSKKKRKISLSEATLEDILSVDGFGPKLADKVFRRVRSYDGELTEEDVLGIPGVGESRLSALKEHFIIPETESEAEEAGRLDEKTCPYCGKKLDEHNRKQHADYIYCPHCLKYLKKDQK